MRGCAGGRPRSAQDLRHRVREFYQFKKHHSGHYLRENDIMADLPTSLRQLDVPRHLLQQIAERAYAHPVVRKNPRPIVNAGDVSAILEIAW